MYFEDHLNNYRKKQNKKYKDYENKLNNSMN